MTATPKGTPKAVTVRMTRTNPYQPVIDWLHTHDGEQWSRTRTCPGGSAFFDMFSFHHVRGIASVFGFFSIEPDSLTSWSRCPQPLETADRADDGPRWKDAVPCRD